MSEKSDLNRMSSLEVRCFTGLSYFSLLVASLGKDICDPCGPRTRNDHIESVVTYSILSNGPLGSSGSVVVFIFLFVMGHRQAKPLLTLLVVWRSPTTLSPFVDAAGFEPTTFCLSGILASKRQPLPGWAMHQYATILPLNYDPTGGTDRIRTCIFCSVAESWTRTNDLRVMSPTSYHCSIPPFYLLEPVPGIEPSVSGLRNRCFASKA